MRATVGLGLILVALAGAPARGKGKKGRVVRIERSHTGTPRTVRMCSNPQPDGSASCYGVPPTIGEIGTVVDDTGVRGKIAITDVSPTPDRCGNDTGWNIKSRLVSGDLTQVSSSGAVMLDYKVGQGAHMVVNNVPPLPNPHDGEIEMLAYSDDNDEVPEIFESWYPCEADGLVHSWSTGTSGYYCLVYYGRVNASYVEERVDVVKNCY